MDDAGHQGSSPGPNPAACVAGSPRRRPIRDPGKCRIPSIARESGERWAETGVSHETHASDRVKHPARLMSGIRRRCGAAATAEKPRASRRSRRRLSGRWSVFCLDLDDCRFGSAEEEGAVPPGGNVGRRPQDRHAGSDQLLMSALECGERYAEGNLERRRCGRDRPIAAAMRSQSMTVWSRLRMSRRLMGAVSSCCWGQHGRSADARRPLTPHSRRCSKRKILTESA